MKKRGRKRIDINFELVEKLASIFCTGEEIAYVLGIDYETLAKRIREHYKMPAKDFISLYQSKGKASLRRKQFEVAMNGNVTMLIWLGKQYLGQKEPAQELQLSKQLPEFEDMDDNELIELIKKLKDEIKL